MKWFNKMVNEWFQVNLNCRETDFLALAGFVGIFITFIFTMFTAIFPNI